MREIIDFIALVLLYWLVFYRKWKAQGRAVLVVNTLMFVYLAFVLYFTLMPIITALPFLFNHPYVPMNLTPFIDVAAGYGDYNRQVALNVIMTVPFGLLFPLARLAKSSAQAARDQLSNREPSLLGTVGATFLLSFGIELLQPLLSGARSSDITDIITNVIGGAIGYLLYLILRPLAVKVLTLLAKRG